MKTTRAPQQAKSQAGTKFSALNYVSEDPNRPPVVFKRLVVVAPACFPRRLCKEQTLERLVSHHAPDFQEYEEPNKNTEDDNRASSQFFISNLAGSLLNVGSMNESFSYFLHSVKAQAFPSTRASPFTSSSNLWNSSAPPPSNRIRSLLSSRNVGSVLDEAAGSPHCQPSQMMLVRI